MEVYEQAILTRKGITPSSFTSAWYRDVTAKVLDTEPMFGNSLLHLCAYTDNTSWLSTLLSINSVDVNVQNNHGETPLHWASKMNSLDTADLLIRAGSDINARDQSESCPLHLAAAQGHPEMVMLLLNLHCDADAVDADGFSAVVVARQQMMKLVESNKQPQKIEGEMMVSRSNHNAFMSVITILQRHKSNQNNNHNNQVLRGRSSSISPNRRKDGSAQSQPSYLRETGNGSRSRSPSPPRATADTTATTTTANKSSSARIRKNDPREEPPKPAFYIPKIEYAPAFFITSSDSTEVPPVKPLHHRLSSHTNNNQSSSSMFQRGDVTPHTLLSMHPTTHLDFTINTSSQHTLSTHPHITGDTTDDSIFDMLGGQGLGPSDHDHPNTDRRGASVSPPRPPHAYAAPNGSAVYKVCLHTFCHYHFLSFHTFCHYTLSVITHFLSLPTTGTPSILTYLRS